MSKRFPRETNATNTISVAASGPGTAYGGGTYTRYTTITVHARANSGAEFLYWKWGSNIVSYNADYSFTVVEDKNLTAYFQTIPTYTISVGASGPGNAYGGGNYKRDTSCTVSASAWSGARFDGWYEGSSLVSSSTSYTFTVTKARSLQARFSYIPTYTISVGGTDGGQVYGGGTYTQGESCTVNAVADSGRVFIAWYEGDTIVSTSARYTFTVNRGRSLFAHFGYTVTSVIQPSGSGYVIGTGNYDVGQTVTIEIGTYTGFDIKRVAVNGTVREYISPFTIYIDKNYTISLQCDYAEMNVTIMRSGSIRDNCLFSINDGPLYNHSVTLKARYNDNITLIATDPREYQQFFKGYKLEGATTYLSTDAYYIFTVPFVGSRQITLFVEWGPSSQRSLTIESAYGGTTDPPPNTYDTSYRTSYHITAIANEGYEIARWEIFGLNQEVTYIYDAIEIDIETLSNDITVKPLFEQRRRYIIVGVDPIDSGHTSPSGLKVYDEGDRVDIEAIQDVEGWKFTGWKVPPNSPFTPLERSERTLHIPYFTQSYWGVYTAHFVETGYTKYLVDVQASEGGEIVNADEINGLHVDNTTLTIITHALPGYHFVGWSDDDEHPRRTIVVHKNWYLTAYFKKDTSDTVTITTRVYPPGSGTVTGGGTYTPGTLVQYTATPNEGYIFSRWSMTNLRLKTVNIIARKTTTYTAYFARKTLISELWLFFKKKLPRRKLTIIKK